LFTSVGLVVAAVFGLEQMLQPVLQRVLVVADDGKRRVTQVQPDGHLVLRVDSPADLEAVFQQDRPNDRNKINQSSIRD
jgi:hypothetical protein